MIQLLAESNLIELIEVVSVKALADHNLNDYLRLHKYAFASIDQIILCVASICNLTDYVIPIHRRDPSAGAFTSDIFQGENLAFVN